MDENAASVVRTADAEPLGPPTPTEEIATLFEANGFSMGGFRSNYRVLNVEVIETASGFCLDLTRLPEPWTVEVQQRVEWDDAADAPKPADAAPPGNIVLTARYDALGLVGGRYDPTFAPSRNQELLDVWVHWQGSGPSVFGARIGGVLSSFWRGNDFRDGNLAPSYPRTDKVMGEGRYAMRRYSLRPRSSFFISEDDRIACSPRNYDAELQAVVTSARNPTTSCVFRVRGGDELRAAYVVPSSGVPSLGSYAEAIETALDAITTDC